MPTALSPTRTHFTDISVKPFMVAPDYFTPLDVRDLLKTALGIGFLDFDDLGEVQGLQDSSQ